MFCPVIIFLSLSVSLSLLIHNRDILVSIKNAVHEGSDSSRLADRKCEREDSLRVHIRQTCSLENGTDA